MLNLDLYERESFGVGGNLNWLYGVCDTPYASYIGRFTYIVEYCNDTFRGLF